MGLVEFLIGKKKDVKINLKAIPIKAKIEDAKDHLEEVDLDKNYLKKAKKIIDELNSYLRDYKLKNIDLRNYQDKEVLLCINDWLNTSQSYSIYFQGKEEIDIEKFDKLIKKNISQFEKDILKSYRRESH